MQITLSELKTNTGKYIALADKEDVFVTKNGKRVAKITNSKINKLAAAKALFGILPPDTDLDKARRERLGQ
jgi:prevent-host-death family protein